MKSIRKIDLRYGDSDQMGVIYHANYLAFFEQGRTQFLKDVGFDYHKVEEQGIIYPVRDVQVTYLKSMRFGEDCYVETSLDNFTKVKTTYYHEIKNQAGEVKCKAKTTVVCVDKETFKPVRIDQVLPHIYQAYMDLK
jgi:acyl-CoA thioester hydrolase